MRTIVIHSGNLDRTHRYWLDHHKLRHEIFVDRLGWDMTCHNGMEYDQFDTIAARYVVVVDDADRVRAVSRLVPTSSPYMIETLWPDWLEGAPPNNPNVWEASRFGCCASLTTQQRSEAIRLMLATIYNLSRSHRVENLLMVMPSFIFERIIRPCGYDVQYIGAERVIDRLRTRLASVPIGEAMTAPMPCHTARRMTPVMELPNA